MDLRNRIADGTISIAVPPQMVAEEIDTLEFADGVAFLYKYLSSIKFVGTPYVLDYLELLNGVDREMLDYLPTKSISAAVHPTTLMARAGTTDYLDLVKHCHWDFSYIVVKYRHQYHLVSRTSLLPIEGIQEVSDTNRDFLDMIGADTSLLYDYGHSAYIEAS